MTVMIVLVLALSQTGSAFRFVCHRGEFAVRDALGVLACHWCGAGYYMPLVSHLEAACWAAEKGHYVSGGGAYKQEPCYAGKYQPNTAQTHCLPASVGHFVGIGKATSQTQCSAGSSQDKTGQFNCWSCKRGEYQPSTGQVKCLKAQAGHYVVRVGSKEQDKCPLGSYQPSTGAQACLDASAGHFVDAKGASAQTKCLAGTYQPYFGTSSCIQARIMHFVSGTGATADEACAAGTFTDTVGEPFCHETECIRFPPAVLFSFGPRSQSLAQGEVTSCDRKRSIVGGMTVDKTHSEASFSGTGFATMSSSSKNFPVTGTSFSVFVSVQLSSPQSGTKYYVIGKNGAADDEDWGIFVEALNDGTNMKLHFERKKNGVTTSVSETKSLNLKAFTIGFSYNDVDGKVRLIYDGEEMGTGTIAGGLKSDGTSPIHVGGTSANIGSKLTGKVFMIAIYNEALSVVDSISLGKKECLECEAECPIVRRSSNLELDTSAMSLSFGSRSFDFQFRSWSLSFSTPISSASCVATGSGAFGRRSLMNEKGLAMTLDGSSEAALFDGSGVAVVSNSLTGIPALGSSFSVFATIEVSNAMAESCWVSVMNKARTRDKIFWALMIKVLAGAQEMMIRVESTNGPGATVFAEKRVPVARGGLMTFGFVLDAGGNSTTGTLFYEGHAVTKSVFSAGMSGDGVTPVRVGGFAWSVKKGGAVTQVDTCMFVGTMHRAVAFDGIVTGDIRKQPGLNTCEAPLHENGWKMEFVGSSAASNWSGAVLVNESFSVKLPSDMSVAMCGSQCAVNNGVAVLPRASSVCNETVCEDLFVFDTGLMEPRADEEFEIIKSSAKIEYELLSFEKLNGPLTTPSPSAAPHPTKLPTRATNHVIDGNGDRQLQVNLESPSSESSTQWVFDVYYSGTCWYPNYFVRRLRMQHHELSIKFDPPLLRNSICSDPGCHANWWHPKSCVGPPRLDVDEISNRPVTVTADWDLIGSRKADCLYGGKDARYEFVFTCAPPNIGPPLNSWTMEGGAEKSKSRSWSYTFSPGSTCLQPHLSIDIYEIGNAPVSFSISSGVMTWSKTCNVPRNCIHGYNRCATYVDMTPYIGKKTFQPWDRLVIDAHTEVTADNPCGMIEKGIIYNSFARLTMTCFAPPKPTRTKSTMEIGVLDGDVMNAGPKPGIFLKRVVLDEPVPPATPRMESLNFCCGSAKSSVMWDETRKLRVVEKARIAVKVTTKSNGQLKSAASWVAIKSITGYFTVKKRQLFSSDMMSVDKNVVMYRGPTLPGAKISETLRCSDGYFATGLTSYWTMDGSGGNGNKLSLKCSTDAGNVEIVNSLGAVTPSAFALTCPAGTTLQGISFVKYDGYPWANVGSRFMRAICDGDYGFSSSKTGYGLRPMESAGSSRSCPAGLRLCGIYIVKQSDAKTLVSGGNICCKYLKYEHRAKLRQELFLFGSRDRQCDGCEKPLESIDTTEKLRLVMSLSLYRKKDVIVGAFGVKYSVATRKFERASGENAFACQVPEMLSSSRHLTSEVNDGDVLVYEYSSGSFSTMNPAYVSSDALYTFIVTKKPVTNPKVPASNYDGMVQTCAGQSRIPLKINSAFVLELARTACRELSYGSCWLGLKWHANVLEWLWSDGTPLFLNEFDTHVGVPNMTGGASEVAHETTSTMSPYLIPHGQCAIMETRTGKWKMSPCTAKSGVLCGEMISETSRSDFGDREFESSCVPNLNSYLANQKVEIRFEACDFFDMSPMNIADILKVITISLTFKDGNVYTLYPQWDKYDRSGVWHSYALKVREARLAELRESVVGKAGDVALLVVEAMNKDIATPFICFKRAQLDLFQEVLDVPGRPPANYTKTYIQRFALGPQCSGKFVQIIDGSNDMVICQDKLELLPNKVLDNFFEISIRSCNVDQNDVDGYTMQRLQIRLMGSNRAGRKTDTGETVTEMTDLPEVSVGKVGPKTLWERGERFRFFYNARASTTDFLSNVAILYPNGAHNVKVQFRFCPNEQKSLPASVATMEIGTVPSLDELRFTTRVYLVIYGTHGRSEAKEIGRDIFHYDATGSFTFTKNIGHVTAIGFETEKTETMTGAFGKVCDLTIQYSDQTSPVSINSILPDGEEGVFGNVGRLDQQTNRYVMKFEMSSDSDIYDEMSKELGTLCLSRVEVASFTGETKVGQLTNRQIGSCDGCSNATEAYLEWAICDVIVKKCEWGSPNIVRSTLPSSGVGTMVAQCVNKERFTWQECSIGRTVTIQTISSNSTHNFSSITGQSSFSHGFSFTPQGKDVNWHIDPTVGVSGNPLNFGFTATVNAGGGEEYPDFGNTNVTDGHWDHTASVTVSNYDKTVTLTRSKAIELSCNGKMMIPPSHNISYRLELNERSKVTYTYTCTTELVLCSSLTKAEQTFNNPTFTVPVKHEVVEEPTCEVVFSPARAYHATGLKCNEEQEIAWLSGSSFVPTCDPGNVKFYASCQCVEPTRNSQGICACFTNHGLVNTNKGVRAVAEGSTTASTCALLNCDGPGAVSAQPQSRLLHGKAVRESKLAVFKRPETGNTTALEVTVFVCIGTVLVLSGVICYRLWKRFGKTDHPGEFGVYSESTPLLG